MSQDRSDMHRPPEEMHPILKQVRQLAENCNGEKCGRCRNCLKNNIHPNMPMFDKKVLEPYPRNKWVLLNDRKPPFNTHVLFQTIENIVFFGFRRDDDTFVGVAITKSNMYTVEAEFKDVVACNLSSDPAPVSISKDKKNEVTKITMTEGLAIDPEIKGDIEDIQESN